MMDGQEFWDRAVLAALDGLCASDTTIGVTVPLAMKLADELTIARAERLAAAGGGEQRDKSKRAQEEP